MARQSAFSCVFAFAAVALVAVAIITFERSHAESPPTALPTEDASKSSNEVGGYLGAKQAYEQHWREKIERATAFLQGAVIEVDVVLSPDAVYREEVVEYGDKPIPSKVETLINSWRRDKVEHDGVGSVDSDYVPQVDEGEESLESTAYNLPSHTERTIEREPFAPEWVSVVISVPRSYLRQVLLDREGSGKVTEAQLHTIQTRVTSDIETIAVSLTPRAPAGEETFPRVQVIWHDD